MSEALDLATVAVECFEPLLNEKFSATLSDGASGQEPVELELIQADPSRFGGPENQRVPFSLLFQGPIGQALGQGTYTVSHPRTGDMPLFLVPVASVDARTRLQGVFN